MDNGIGQYSTNINNHAQVLRQNAMSFIKKLEVDQKELPSRYDAHFA